MKNPKLNSNQLWQLDQPKRVQRFGFSKAALCCLALILGIVTLVPQNASAGIVMCIWDNGQDLFMTADGDYDMTNAASGDPFFLGPVAVVSPAFQVFGWSTGSEAETVGYEATFSGALSGNMSAFESVTIATVSPIAFWNGTGTDSDTITHNVTNAISGTVNEWAMFADVTLADLGMVAGETVNVSWGSGGVNEVATISTKSVPEPSAAFLFGTLITMGYCRRKRK